MTTVCHEEGRVTGITNTGFAKVTVARGEACGSCDVKGACQALGGQKKDHVLFLENSIDALEGDMVRLTMNESSIVKASAILYLLPALSLISGAAIGYYIAGSIGKDVDIGSILGSLVGLILGFMMSWFISKQFAKKKSFIPKLTAITYRSSTSKKEHSTD